MKLISGALFCFAFLLSGCLKKDIGCAYKTDNKVAPAAEEQALLTYLSSNSITATKHGSNMYYQVVQSGTGDAPGLCSGVEVKYAGRLTNGTTFDSKNSAIFTLGSLIEGWKLGIPLIKKGGRIVLYIPPTLGYGAVDVKDITGVVIIPANSILVFDITLNNIQ